jgi:hypothetical protein
MLREGRSAAPRALDEGVEDLGRVIVREDDVLGRELVIWDQDPEDSEDASAVFAWEDDDERVNPPSEPSRDERQSRD